jgi:2-succinyl-5-enolpyruvyl-6-hydroxy-3-cyclohexene-1-carboxylate synthase
MNLTDIARRIEGRRGLIVAGQSNDPDFAAMCADLATSCGFPIIADPLSGLRFGDHHNENLVACGDQLVAAGALDSLLPDVVVRFGPVPTSKPVWAWLEQHPEIDQILIDVHARDATHSATTTLRLPAPEAAAAIAAGINQLAPVAWLESWQDADRSAAQIVAAELAAAEFPNEPRIAEIVTSAAPDGSALTVGSSMPIRDVDAFGGKSAKRLRVFGNRGANGIDGVLSAALGTAAAGTNAIALLGDVSAFHDLNAIGTAAQLNLPITIIVINNDGGGIFHFLPHHDPEVLDPALFARYLATPHGTDFAAVAEAFEIETHRVDDAATLTKLVATPSKQPRLIQIKTNRDENLALHRRVAGALRGLLR